MKQITIYNRYVKPFIKDYAYALEKEDNRYIEMVHKELRIKNNIGYILCRYVHLDSVESFVESYWMEYDLLQCLVEYYNKNQSFPSLHTKPRHAVCRTCQQKFLQYFAKQLLCRKCDKEFSDAKYTQGCYEFKTIIEGNGEVVTNVYKPFVVTDKYGNTQVYTKFDRTIKGGVNTIPMLPDDSIFTEALSRFFNHRQDRDHELTIISDVEHGYYLRTKYSLKKGRKYFY